MEGRERRPRHASRRRSSAENLDQTDRSRPTEAPPPGGTYHLNAPFGTLTHCAIFPRVSFLFASLLFPPFLPSFLPPFLPSLLLPSRLFPLFLLARRFGSPRTYPILSDRPARACPLSLSASLARAPHTRPRGPRTNRQSSFPFRSTFALRRRELV